MTPPSSDPAATAQHPGQKLMRVLPNKHMPNKTYFDQHYMHPNCQNAIVGPRFKCTLCQNFDLCASCEADPNATHQARYGFTHLFVKIPKPLNQQEWTRTVFGHAAICKEQHASPSASDPATNSEDGNEEPEDSGLVPTVEEPETSLIVVEETETEDVPPLPEDPFTGTGTQPFDFLTGIRAASQLVGLGRDVLSHPYLQQAAPSLKHITAFMSALNTPSDTKAMPSVDVSQLAHATEQLINSIISSKRSETPSQNEVEEMLSQTYQASETGDPGDVNLTDETESYYTPVMKANTDTSDPIHSTPLEDALAANFQKLLHEQLNQSEP